jgi:hypothetical protein
MKADISNMCAKWKMCTPLKDVLSPEGLSCRRIETLCKLFRGEAEGSKAEGGFIVGTMRSPEYNILYEKGKVGITDLTFPKRPEDFTSERCGRFGKTTWHDDAEVQALLPLMEKAVAHFNDKGFEYECTGIGNIGTFELQ